MAQIVELPNGDTIEFPDDMTTDAMSSAIRSSFPDSSVSPAPESKGLLDRMKAAYGAGSKAKAPEGVTEATFDSGVPTVVDPNAIIAPGSVMNGYVPTSSASRIAPVSMAGYERIKDAARENPSLAEGDSAVARAAAESLNDKSPSASEMSNTVLHRLSGERRIAEEEKQRAWLRNQPARADAAIGKLYNLEGADAEQERQRAIRNKSNVADVMDVAAHAPLGLNPTTGQEFVSGILGNTAGRIWGDFEQGTTGAIGSSLSHLGRKAGIDTVQKLGDSMQAYAERATPVDANLFDQVVSGFGSMGSFMIPGLGVMRGSQALSILAPASAKWLGAGTMAGIEAAGEADNTYKDSLRQGLPEAESANRAENVFWQNMALLGVTDKVGFFNDLRGLGKKVLAAKVTEGGQEVAQQVIQNKATDRPTWEGAGEAGLVGAIVGGGVAAAQHLAYGDAPQPKSTPADVLAATTTDEAIAKADESVSADIELSRVSDEVGNLLDRIDMATTETGIGQAPVAPVAQDLTPSGFAPEAAPVSADEAYAQAAQAEEKAQRVAAFEAQQTGTGGDPVDLAIRQAEAANVRQAAIDANPVIETAIQREIRKLRERQALRNEVKNGEIPAATDAQVAAPSAESQGGFVSGGADVPVAAPAGNEAGTGNRAEMAGAGVRSVNPAGAASAQGVTTNSVEISSNKQAPAVEAPNISQAAPNISTDQGSSNGNQAAKTELRRAQKAMSMLPETKDRLISDGDISKGSIGEIEHIVHDSGYSIDGEVASTGTKYLKISNGVDSFQIRFGSHNPGYRFNSGDDIDASNPLENSDFRSDGNDLIAMLRERITSGRAIEKQKTGTNAADAHSKQERDGLEKKNWEAAKEWVSQQRKNRPEGMSQKDWYSLGIKPEDWPGWKSSTSEPVQKTAETVQVADQVARAKATLDAAGVTGTDRTSTIAAVRRGDLTPEEVADAHPAKDAEAPTEPAIKTYPKAQAERMAKSFTGQGMPTEVYPHGDGYALRAPNTKTPDAQFRTRSEQLIADGNWDELANQTFPDVAGNEQEAPQQAAKPEPLPDAPIATERTAALVQSTLAAQIGSRPEVTIHSGLKAAGTLSRNTIKAINSVAKIFKQRVVYFQSDRPTADGFIKDGVIYLNVDSSVSPLAVLGHELTHRLQNEQPEAWHAVAKVMAQRMDQAKLIAMYRSYHGNQLTDAQIVEKLQDEKALEDLMAEMVSDYAGNQFTDEAFWGDVFGRMAQGKPEGLVKRLVERLRMAVMQMVGLMNKAINQPGFREAWLTGEENPEAWGKEVNAALKGAYAQWVDAINTTGYEAMQEEHAAKFSDQRTDELPRTITIDGKERPTTNGNGKPIAQTEEGVRNFYAWFGNSAVVDEQGRPRVVYHGTTSDFKEFDRSERGTNTQASGAERGFFFAGDSSDSNLYIEIAQNRARNNYEKEPAGRILNVYLKAENPLILTPFEEANVDEDIVNDLIDSDPVALDYAVDNGYDAVIWPHGNINNSAYTAVVFNPSQIKSATGNNGEFSAENPDIRFSTRRSDQENVGKRFSTPRIIGDNNRQRTPEQLAMFKNVGREVNDLTTIEKIKQWANKRWVQGVVDQFAPVKDLNQDAYRLMRQSKGATGAFEAFMHHGKLSIVDGTYDADQSGGVLKDVFFPLGKEATDFLYWIAGHRAERLAMEGKERLFSPADIKAAKSLADGVADFDYTLPSGQVTRDRTLIYKDSIAKFNEYNKNIMDMAEQSGLIDQASRHLWEHEFYVPFYRVIDDADGGVRGMNIKQGVVRQQAFKKLKGGTDGLNDLLANTMMNWAHLIDAAAKNRAAKATLDAAQAVGIAQPVASNMAQYASSNGKLLPPGTKNTVWYSDKGNKAEFVVDDPYLLSAIQGLEYAGMRGPAMDALSKTKHWLTMGVTASPFFKIRNLIRDSVQSIGVSGLGYNVFSNLKQGIDLTNHDRQEYVSALAAGGLIRFGTMLEGNEASRVRRLIKEGASDAHILDNESKIRKFWDKTLGPAVDAYNELGNRGEEINRMALYNQLRKQGMSHGEAAFQARDLMDFSMQGNFTTIRFLTQVVPFMNARLQGLYKLGKAAKEDPAKFAIVTTSVALMSLALLWAYHDDDDWKKREDWDRDNYWWFKFGGNAYRIPKPFEIGAIGTLAERSAELIFDNEMTGRRFASVTTKLIADQLAMNPVPQLIKPMVDVYSNKDSFSGRPIETMSMERLDRDYRFNANTSMVARGISTAGNTATGGNFFSPVQVDHLVRGYFAWLGTFAVGAADMAVRSASKEPTRPTADYWKVATGGMVAEVDSASSRYVSQMYDQAKELEAAYGTHRQLIKEGKGEEAAAYRESNADKLKRYAQVEAVKKSESTLNERIRLIERSSMDPDVKKERITAIRKQKDLIARRLTTSP